MNKADLLANSIDNIASQPTERKSPGGSSNNANETHENFTKTEFFSEEPENIEQENIKDVENKSGSLSEKTIEASGKTGAFLLGSSIELTFNVIERVVFINRFSANEKQRLVILDEKSENEYSDADRSLNQKFLAVSKKHDKIKDKIPLKSKELEALELACSEYTRITGKTLNPNLIIGTTIVQIFANRALDIFL